MADRKCQYCTKIATHSCPCQSTISYFCRLHQDEHEQIFATHQIKNLFFTPNLKAKRDLVNKIQEIRNEAIEKALFTIEKCNKIVENVIIQASKVNDRFQSFISLCSSIISEIISIEKISEKSFYCPLERALLSQNVDELIQNFQSPTVKIDEIGKLFTYCSSIFPHSLYNSSNFLLNMLIKKKLRHILMK